MCVLLLPLDSEVALVLQCAVVGGEGLLSNSKVTRRRLYSLQLLRVKSLAQGQLDKRLRESSECYMLAGLQKVGKLHFVSESG